MKKFFKFIILIIPLVFVLISGIICFSLIGCDNQSSNLDFEFEYVNPNDSLISKE